MKLLGPVCRNAVRPFLHLTRPAPLIDTSISTCESFAGTIEDDKIANRWEEPNKLLKTKGFTSGFILGETNSKPTGTNRKPTESQPNPSSPDQTEADEIAVCHRCGRMLRHFRTTSSNRFNTTARPSSPGHSRVVAGTLRPCGSNTCLGAGL